MHDAYLLLGGNIGDTLKVLNYAVTLIKNRVGTVVKQSSFYKTEPWGNTNQQFFLNRALVVQTVLKPEELMYELLSIERDMGRIREEKWEPRIIDIDIILYDDYIQNSAMLTLPHPHMHKRRFVLEPLAEIASEVVHPVLNVSIQTLLNNCPDQGLVEKL